MELAVTCSSCGKQFNVEHLGSSGVADCPYCGATIKFDHSPRERAIAHGVPTRHGPDQIHHLQSHANLPVSHKTVPKLDEPKPRSSLMELVGWLVVTAVVVGVVWWWFSRPPPPPPPRPPAIAVVDSSAQPVPVQPALPEPAKEPVEVALTNPGFEKVLAGWTIAQTAGLIRTMTDAAHSGNRGLRMADDSTERDTVVSYAFSFVPGDKYECRFWARVVSGKGVAVLLLFANAEGAALENRVEIPATTKQWKEFTVTAKAPGSAVKGEIWIATTEQGTVLADFDDFRLRHFE